MDDLGDLVLDGIFQIVDVAEVLSCLRQSHHFLSQIAAAGPTLAPNIGDGHVNATRLAGLVDGLEFSLGVGWELVDSYHHWQAKGFLDSGQVLIQVRQASLDGLHVFRT